MSGEAALRRYVRENLAIRGVLTCHHEDALNAGVPDLSYSGHGRHGWIELKSLAAWPARETTIVRMARYSDSQRNWLRLRWEAAGYTWMLLRVGRAHLLFDGLTAARNVGYMTRPALLMHATRRWDTTSGMMIDFNELVREITL